MKVVYTPEEAGQLILNSTAGPSEGQKATVRYVWHPTTGNLARVEVEWEAGEDEPEAKE